MPEIDLTDMKLNDINVDAITNSDKTGVFDELMLSVNENINEQFTDGRITSSEYGQVYLGSLQAVLSQSIDFVLREQLVEVQIASALADNELKAKQLEILVIEEDIKQFELDNLLPEQLLKLQEEIDILQTQDSEMILDGAKKRLIMDEQLESADLEQILLTTEEDIKTAQLAEITDSTLRANTQLTDGLATSASQRVTMYTDQVLKDKQAAKLGLDNVMKTSEANRDSDTNFIYVPNYIETP